MPIIEIPSADVPLSQGDILHGVCLFATAEGWLNGGGDPSRYPHSMCLVLSRPCNVAHKSNIVVAAVEKYNDSMPSDIESFDEMLDFLTTMRDGEGAPDIFYLGHLPNQQGRFCCRLDAMFSLELPSDLQARSEFATRCRVGSLNHQFLRDLHIRLFRAFASLGFDDHRWMSMYDLELLVSKGKSDMFKAKRDLQDATTARLNKEARGQDIPAGQIKQLENLERNRDKLVQSVAPFEQELQRRKDTIGET